MKPGKRRRIGKCLFKYLRNPKYRFQNGAEYLPSNIIISIFFLSLSIYEKMKLARCWMKKILYSRKWNFHCLARKSLLPLFSKHSEIPYIDNLIFIDFFIVVKILDIHWILFNIFMVIGTGHETPMTLFSVCMIRMGFLITILPTNWDFIRVACFVKQQQIRSSLNPGVLRPQALLFDLHVQTFCWTLFLQSCKHETGTNSVLCNSDRHPKFA